MSGKMRPDTSLGELRAQARRLGLDDALIVSQGGIRALKAKIGGAIAASKELARAKEFEAEVNQSNGG